MKGSGRITSNSKWINKIITDLKPSNNWLVSKALSLATKPHFIHRAAWYSTPLWSIGIRWETYRLTVTNYGLNKKIIRKSFAVKITRCILVTLLLRLYLFGLSDFYIWVKSELEFVWNVLYQISRGKSFLFNGIPNGLKLQNNLFSCNSFMRWTTTCYENMKLKEILFRI